MGCAGTSFDNVLQQLLRLVSADLQAKVVAWVVFSEVDDLRGWKGEAHVSLQRGDEDLAVVFDEVILEHLSAGHREGRLAEWHLQRRRLQALEEAIAVDAKAKHE